MPVKIFVGNLQVESCRDTESALRKLFEQFGTVVECDILTGKNFGFVHMENEEEANIAIAALHGEEFFGGQINVEKSANQGSKGKKGPPGGDRGGRGGRGGGRGGFSRDRDQGRTPMKAFGDRAVRGPRYDPYARPPGRDDDMFDAYPPSTPRDPILRDMVMKDPYLREAFEREMYLRRRAAMAAVDPYGSRPGPEYYKRPLPPPRSAYYDDGRQASDPGLVSYPTPRSSGYAKPLPPV